MRKVILLSILYMLWGFTLSAQNINTQSLQWQISYVDNINTGERVLPENEKLISYSPERIEWQNGDGTVKHVYLINSTSGSWSNINNNGSIVYQINIGDQFGTLTFERTKDEIMVRILLAKDDALPEIYEFKIITITEL